MTDELYLETLRDALNNAESALADAERNRDAWEPDVENPDHTAPYDAALDELNDDMLPAWLRHVPVATLMREHAWGDYLDGFNTWEDGLRGERERRQTWDEYEELCDACDDAESARDDAQIALDDYEEKHA